MNSLLNRLIDILYPQNNICHLCGRKLMRAGEVVLCAECEDELSACRLLAHEAVSIHEPLRVCVSAYAYVGRARELIMALKFGSDRAAAIPLAAGLCDAYADASELHGAAIVVPVPLHKRRERERGYNQAELIAAEFCAHTGLELRADALNRVRNTSPQSKKTREQRLVGVLDAFEASADIKGDDILLIDDVLTTGATLAACAKALLSAGAKSVSALTVSRSDGSMLIA